jgi:hypothetical protein
MTLKDFLPILGPLLSLLVAPILAYIGYSYGRKSKRYELLDGERIAAYKIVMTTLQNLREAMLDLEISTGLYRRALKSARLTEAIPVYVLDDLKKEYQLLLQTSRLFKRDQPHTTMLARESNVILEVCRILLFDHSQDYYELFSEEVMRDADRTLRLLDRIQARQDILDAQTIKAGETLRDELGLPETFQRAAISIRSRREAMRLSAGLPKELPSSSD